jgi:transketolase
MAGGANYIIESSNNEKAIERVPTRDGFGDAMVVLGREDPRIIGLTGDLSESTRLDKFQSSFPDRFFEVGVAEQNMMGIAAGLALAGKIPFVTSYATFSPGRNWDQLRVSVCYSRANVKIAGHHTGVSVGPDGATHQALEDIAMTRVLPGMVVLAPCDRNEAYQATIAAAQYKGPVYLRLTREATPVFTSLARPFQIGKAYVARQGSDVTIIVCGPLAYEALKAAEMLAREKVQAELIICPSIKPIDSKLIYESASVTGSVVTVEEHQINGGLGGAVCEVLAEHCPVPVERVGMPDVFGESGEPDELLAKYGMDRFAIITAVKRVMKRKGVPHAR